MPEELREGGEQRFIGQGLRGGFGDAEVDDPGRTVFAFGDENVRGFEIAVNDALLMRVLHGMANVDEQFKRVEIWKVFGGRNSR